MKVTTVLSAMIGTASVALAQGVTSAIAPTATAPASCSANYDGSFEVTVVKVASGAEKRDAPIAKRDSCSGDGILVLTLANGILTDAKQRTGYIASNFQFQFDAPPQAGAIYTSGFSACANGSLALGGSAVFYECDSGDFYNLYDRSWAAQCSPVEITMLPCGSGDASQAGDGQVVGTQIITTTVVSALSDGQPQVKTATTGVPLCEVSQINDGQVQVATTPCASITTTPAPASTLAPVSQYSDGQIQVTPAPSVPTVTSGAVATSAPGSAAESSASVVTLPTESKASGTGGGSTLATSKPSGPAASGTPASSAPGSTGTEAPASSGASANTGSVVALLMGLVAAVAFL